ncbi:MAG TPA: hypothetical protein VKA15_19625 [Isosphaeraceae bacterium]|nr:hypothetical protein [Isosphaeraceae bacterium]
MANKRAVSRRPKVKSKGADAVASKQVNHKSTPVRGNSGLSATNTKKTDTHKPGAASTKKPKAVQPGHLRQKPLAMVAPKRRRELEAVRVPQYDRFFDLLTELADSVLSNSDPGVWFMGLYYGPPSNPNDVFMLWVTQQSTGGRFNPRPILDTIKTPSQTVTLNDDQSFIQHVVDVETLSGVLKHGSAGNHPDADVINSLIDAIRAERYHIMLPKNPSNPMLAVANALAPLTEKSAVGARRAKANNLTPTTNGGPAHS